MGLASSVGLLSCNNSSGTKESNAEPIDKAAQTSAPLLSLSLAQWSLNRSIKDQTLDPFDFAKKAKSLGFAGLEYVNQLYDPFLAKYENTLMGMKEMTKRLAERADGEGLENVLIMIDNEGDLGVKSAEERMNGVHNHHKWVDMAHEIGCHAIRINLFGEGNREDQKMASADSMRKLCEYAKDVNINVLVENHGGWSSDPDWVVDVMKMVNMENCGTLPDFGNFCIEREGGARWEAACVNEYKNYYKAVKLMMPYAKAVSAKSYAFDIEGNETKIDYDKMIKTVVDSGYRGYIGVEFEGDLPEEEGIIKTRDLILKALKSAQQ